MKTRNRLLSLLALAASALVGAGGLGGCTHHTVDVQPIKVEPIHMTVDVNIKVDRELDEFFEFEDEAAAPAAESVPPEVHPAPGEQGPMQSDPATMPRGQQGGVS